jgi:chemotaxis response regulator CheB
MQSAGTQGIRPIRLLIVDDSQDMVQNVQKLLHFEPDIQVVGSASNAEEAFVAVAELRPDVVLMPTFRSLMKGLYRVLHRKSPIGQSPAHAEAPGP